MKDFTFACRVEYDAKQFKAQHFSRTVTADTETEARQLLHKRLTTNKNIKNVKLELIG